MHRIFPLHARALAEAAPPGLPDGPLPQPPSPFLRAWLSAVLPWASEAHGARALAHYADECPRAWIQRFYGSPPVVQALVRLPVAQIPPIVAALRRMFEGAARAGVAQLWGCASADELLAAHSRVLDLHAVAFFGCCQPMVSLGAAEQAALEGCAAQGWTAEALLERRLAGHLVHELAHGPARGWEGGPGSFMLHEAAAAVVNLGCAAGHVLADRPGEPVLGLSRALVLGQALVDDLGEDAVWRLALTATGPGDVIGDRAGAALTAADWQVWARSERASFMPPHHDMLRWAKLYDVARADLLPALRALGPVVTPEQALALPDLLREAEAVPWTDMPAWHGPERSTDVASVQTGVRALFTMQRLQPDLQAVPSDPPGGQITLEVAACAMRVGARVDDPHGLAAEWRFPPARCRGLLGRGARRVTVLGALWEQRAQVTDRLLDLCEGTNRLPEQVTIDLRPRSPDRTRVDVAPPSPQLHHSDGVVTLGSCFASRIGERLAAGLFEVAQNPFGILYDPISVARAAERVVSDEALPADLLFFANYRWHSPWHHTAFSDVDRDVAWARVEAALGRARSIGPRLMLLTWGTAEVWEHEGEVVANCHGLEAGRYVRRLLDVDEIVARYDALLARLADAAPALTVVVSVSPIRHLARGVEANAVSKATLVLAASRLAGRHANLRTFPAYELVLDELRDYRWFEDDLVHTNDAATAVVFERFLGAWVAPSSRALVREVAEIRQALVVGPRDAGRRAEQLRGLLARLTALGRSPALPWPAELEVQLQHALRAAEAASGAVGPREVIPVTAPVTPPVRATRVAPERAEQASAEDALGGLERALRPGVWIGWEQIGAWQDAVRGAVRGLVEAHDPGASAAWAGLRAVLDKAEELEDPGPVAGLASPLLRRVVASQTRPDGVTALFELWREAVPAGRLEVDADVLAGARTEDLRAWAALGEELARGRSRPHPRMVELHEQVVKASRSR